MSSIEQMQKEVEQYCKNLILNSTIDDWNGSTFTKNNIRIIRRNYGFEVGIYTDNSHNQKNTEFNINIIFLLGLFASKEKKLLTKKHEELESYFNNKERYERAKETYNLLPIKEIRKNKLKEINEKEL